MKTFWKGKHVLVVGGAGFIGSHTVDALIQKGANAAIVDNLSTGKKENCNPRARFYKLDATSASGIAKVFKREKPDFVMIFSSVVDVPLAIKNPRITAESITATINVLQRSVEYGAKKILFASSGFIYGNAKKRPTPESEPAQPLNPYNIAKATCEHYLRFFSNHYGLPFVALRYSPVYGPRRTIGPIIDYIRHISRGEQAEIFGRKTRDYIFIDDVVHANLTALEADLPLLDPVFNIGTGREVSLEEVYAEVARLLKRPNNKPISRPERVSEVDRFCLDIRKARRILGFRPNITLSDGLLKTIDWFYTKQS